MGREGTHRSSFVAGMSERLSQVLVHLVSKMYAIVVFSIFPCIYSDSSSETPRGQAELKHKAFVPGQHGYSPAIKLAAGHATSLSCLDGARRVGRSVKHTAR